MIFKQKTIQELIKSNRLKSIQKIITSHNCNELDENGHVPLYYAIQYEKADIAGFLLEIGAISALASSTPEVSVMEEVTRTGRIKLLTVFLERNEPLPDTIDGLPTLHFLVTHLRFSDELLQLLIAHGIDINKIDTNKTNKTALAYLLSLDFFPISTLKALLDSGADVNYALSPKERPLTVILDNQKMPKTSFGQFCSVSIVKLLLDYGLDLNYKLILRTGNRMPLSIKALQCKHIDTFITLLENGLPIEPDEFPKLEGFLDVNQFSMKQRRQIVAVNQSRGLNLPLHIAFFEDPKEVVASVVSESNNADDLNRRFTDLVMTTNMKLSKKVALLKPLLEAGADINALAPYAGFEINALTALTCWHDEIDKPIKLAEWLLDNGAKIECQGRSAFLWAIWYNKPDFIELYAEKGADILFKEENGTSMFSKLYTFSPSHNQYNNNQEKVEMVHLLYTICSKQNTPFPLEEPFLYASNDGFTLDRTDILPAFVYLRGDADYKLSMLDVLISCGWDINKKFKGFDSHGSIIAQLLSTAGLEEKIIVEILDKYPEVNMTTPGTEDPLFNVINSDFSSQTVKRFIEKAENINKPVIRNIKDSWIKTITGNYLEFTLDIFKKVNISSATEICKILLEAGINPNQKIKYELQEQYMDGGLYRKEKTLLEEVVSNVNFEVGYFYELFKLLLDYGADPYQRMCFFEETFLHFISQRVWLKESEIITFLEELDRRELLDVESKTNNGGTALLYAAGKCRSELMTYLINKGADIHVVGGFDQSMALHRAISNWNWVAKEDRLKAVQILADAGANLEQIDNDGYSPLMAAAAFGCYTVAEELIKRGVNVNQANSDGKTALHFAVMEPYGYDEYPDDERSEDANVMNEALKFKIIKLLAENGADLNLSHNFGGTALIESIALDCRDLFDGLVKLGASVNAPDCYRRTPLMIASKFGEELFIRGLGRSRELSESFLATDQHGENTLHYLVSRVFQSSDEFASTREEAVLRFMEAFIEHYHIPIIKNNDGASPLHLAAMYGLPQVVQYLIDEHHVDINENDNVGNSLLIYALSFNEELVELEKVTEVVTKLITYGADVNQANEHGTTPLNIAKERELEQIVDLLAQAGAKEASIGY